MARISRYPQDNLVEGTDKLIGTNEDGDVTKTYTLTSLGEWLKYNTQPIATLTSADGTQFIVAAANDGTIQGIPLDSVAPGITSLPVITGTLNVGEVLTAAPGAFTGIPEPTTVLQWQRSDDGLTGWADISGATGTTYLLGSLDEDKYIRVQQTEENILGTATSNSVSTTQIQPAAFSGLLDDYPNAAAAYSLRKLRALYSGSAIKVRRDSDQALQDIGFDSLTNELDVASLESFCSGTDGFIHTWYDQSGSGNDATQTTASSQPKIVSSGSTILENGKATLKFDGSNDSLRNALYTSSQPITYFHLRKYITSNTSIALSFNSVESVYADSLVGGSFRAYFGTYIIYGTSNTNQGLFYGLANGVNSEIQINNNSILTGNLGNRYVNSIDIGYSSRDASHSNIYSQEIIIWESDQSTNRSGIQTNINNFYNIY